MFAQMVPHRRIGRGGGGGGGGGGHMPPQILWSGKVDKKNRGLQLNN
jgi:hypothetical protein